MTPATNPISLLISLLDSSSASLSRPLSSPSIAIFPRSRLTGLLALFVGGLLTAATGAGCAKVKTVSGGGSGGAGGGSGIGPVSSIPGLKGLTVNPRNEMVGLMADANGQVLSATKNFTAEATLNDLSTIDATDRVFWSVSPRIAKVTGGVVTVNAPGIYTVTATNGSISASAELTATFAADKLAPGFTPGNVGKLDATPSGGAVTVAYPLDGAIFPSNFGGVTVQLARTGAQDLVRLSFVGDGLSLKYYAPCEAAPTVGGGCYVTLPSDVTKWFVAASSRSDLTLTARLGSSSSATVAESAPIRVAWADVPLSGGLYYWTTLIKDSFLNYVPPDPSDPRGTAVMRYNFNGDEPVVEPVWTDRGSPRTTPPFQESPPSPTGVDPQSGRPWGEGRCIGCHTISPDGKLMSFSINGSDASSWAILNIANTTLNELDPTASMSPLPGIDALKRYRKTNFATFTTFGPNSDLMVNMYRGKLTLRRVNLLLEVVRDDLFANATPERKTDPFWSADGALFAFATFDPNHEPQTSRYNGDTRTWSQIWSATADVTGPHDDAKVIVPREMGVTSYYPAISHDSRLLVFNKAQCSGPPNPGNYGTGPCDGYDDITASLWLMNPRGGTPMPLTNANGSTQNSNSWPRWSPDSGGFRGRQLYWLAFSSRRAYGLQVNAGAGTGAKPQLWFAAILQGDEFSQDPSRAPVWLPKQNQKIESPTGNHVPQWVKFVVPIQ